MSSTSTPNPPKMKISQHQSFVLTTNPEVFKISPRPGTWDLSEMKNKSSAMETVLVQATSQTIIVQEKTSREFRIATAIDSVQSIDMEDVTVPNPLRDAMYMIGVTISCLIMLAANHSNIPPQYLDWAEKCLRTVRNDVGCHPPNVQGILNHLNHIRGKKPGDVAEINKGTANKTLKTTTKIHLPKNN